MESFEKLTRVPIREFRPYVPGKPIEEIQARFGLSKVVKLASNENPLGPSPRALEALRSGLGELHRYPEGGSTRLRAALASRYEVDPTSVLVGSGSDEIIELLAKTFLDPGDSIVASRHAFIRYKMAGMLMGAEVIETPMKDFRHDLPAMGAAVRGSTKIVFVANPNNPTGTYVTRTELDSFLEVLPRDRLLVLDEAYYEYARELSDCPDAVEYIRRGHRNLISLRTFSKAYGLAGLRCGYAIADPEVIAQLDRIRPPFNVTLPAQVACEAALSDHDHVATTVRVNAEGLQWLRRRLDQEGISYVPSACNFLLVETLRGANETFEKLLRRGIIVRPMAEYGFPRHVRVSVGTVEETAAFVEHFLEVESGA